MGEGHLREEAKPKAKDDNERKVFEAADHERQEAEECGLSVIALHKEKWAKRKAKEELKAIEAEWVEAEWVAIAAEAIAELKAKEGGWI